jgi:nucleoid-associated protein YgaU
MNTRKFKIRWWILVALCVGPLLISCTSGNVEESADGETESYEETVSDSEMSDSGEGDLAESSDSDDTGFDEAKEETADAESSSDQTLASTDSEKSDGAASDSDFESLADDDFENLSFDESGSTKTAGTETATGTDSALGTGSESLSDDSSLFGETTTADAGSTNAVGSADASSSDFGLGSAPGFTDPVSQSKPKMFRASVMPKIPSEAVSKQGANLNRFYFIRKGDTPNSVATLIYGQESRAEDLTSWNSTAWVPGNLIYYVSPKDAGDGQMRSLYEERNLNPTTVSVQRGESISQIALKRLGHVNSWKELAVVNQLDRPDNLSKGQKLKFYEDLGDAPAVASAPLAPPPMAEPIVPPPPPAPVTPPPMELAATAPPPVENKPKVPERKERGSDLNIAKLLKQNLFFITMGLGVGLLLLALVAINRKKRDGGAGEEFNEDAFAPPRKKRR